MRRGFFFLDERGYGNVELWICEVPFFLCCVSFSLKDEWQYIYTYIHRCFSQTELLVAPVVLEFKY